ncbi:MAG: TonB-dependent receptor [Xanthomonadaceae bacterium]|nr:TonB-dependent receptor [Xanthomonadaceae bacterium]
MRFHLLAAAVLIPIGGICIAADSEQTPNSDLTLPPVEVTTSKTPEPVDQTPAMVSVVDSEDLDDTGASNMASALGLVAGVEAQAGGDAGPSSAVPAFWGLHEFDAFLLVVDGVPWGGAFNPMISTFDLNDVQRIEILKGAAPVMYGATSFVGVVQALHYPAGEASNVASLAYGNHDSWSASAALTLPQTGDYRQSFAIDGQSLGFSDRREAVKNGQALYRGALSLDHGTLTIDVGLSAVRDVPPSPVVRSGTTLSPAIPVDANFNPADARIDQDQNHLAIGYARDTAWGEWSSRVSITRSNITDIRAFLHPDLSGAADTQNQSRRIDDDYLDTHLTHRFGNSLAFIVGADALYGYGTQTTRNGNSAYTVPLDGSVLPPPTTSLPVNEIGVVRDRRNFLGQYAQLDWNPDSQWDVVAGLRLNETFENKFSSDLVDPDPLVSETHQRNVVRPTVTLGASNRLWQSGSDEAVLYADYRNAFKPSALDFGPDYQPAVLLPETAQSYEAGLKGALLDGRLNWQAEAFLSNFKNLVVPSSSGFLVNAGGERLQGAELEAHYQLAPDLVLAGSLAYHDAYFTQYLFADPDTGSNVDVAGKALPLSPHLLASAGILYTPKTGFYATLVGNVIGRRFLDEKNTAPAGAYSTLAATVGYRFGRYAVSVQGTNLTNRRPPVTSSEFGSQSFYLLNGRTAWLKLSYSLDR